MSHVFISYSTKNSAYAYKLAQKLTEEGFNVWIDNAQLRSSDNWWESIVHALHSAGAFIVIMSNESRQSRWVQREVTLADNWKIPAFPLLLSGENFEIYVLTQYNDVRNGQLPSSDFYTNLERYCSRIYTGGNDITGGFVPVDPDISVQQAIQNPPKQGEDSWAAQKPAPSTPRIGDLIQKPAQQANMNRPNANPPPASANLNQQSTNLGARPQQKAYPSQAQSAAQRTGSYNSNVQPYSYAPARKQDNFVEPPQSGYAIEGRPIQSIPLFRPHWRLMRNSAFACGLSVGGLMFALLFAFNNGLGLYELGLLVISAWFIQGIVTARYVRDPYGGSLWWYIRSGIMGESLNFLIVGRIYSKWQWLNIPITVIGWPLAIIGTGIAVIEGSNLLTITMRCYSSGCQDAFAIAFISSWAFFAGAIGAYFTGIAINRAWRAKYRIR